ncbi:MAG: FecR domain-containing protein [Immundisolibacterales bacterium]|nr:FecR domain-containing protein [Immundisolibacterales bacterium]
MLACAIGLGSSPASAAVDVGVTTTVRPAALGTPPVSETRVLEVGDRLVFEERIETNREGSTQVLFLDGTALSIGGDALVTLDTFVYDPGSRTGDLAVSILKGIVRFIGGRISKLNPVTIRTPRAEIGIRGGIAIIEATESASAVSFLFGEVLTITPIDALGRLQGDTFRLSTPGFRVEVRDGAVSEPVPVVSGTVTDTVGPAPDDDAQAAEADESQSAEIEQIAGEAMGPEGANRSPDAYALPTSSAPAVAQASVPDTALEDVQSDEIRSQVDAPEVEPPVVEPPEESRRYEGNFRRVPTQLAANGFTPLGSDRLSAGDPGFSDARRAAGRLLLTITEDGEALEFDLPAATWNVGGELAFANVEQPDGSRISGTGYWDPLGQYFRYEVTRTFVDGANREASERVFLFGGERFEVEEFVVRPGFTFGAYELRPDAALGAALPFLRAEDGGNIAGARISPFYATVRPRDENAEIIDNAASVNSGVAALAIEGRGASQRSALTMATLSSYTSSGGTYRRTGAVRGTSRTAAGSGSRRVASSVGTVPTGAGAYAGGAHVLGSPERDTNEGSLFFVLGNYALDEPQTFPPGGAWSGEFDLATGFERWESYTFTHTATRIDNPPGVGEQRSTRILNGYAAGLYEPVVYPGPGESPFVDPVSVANRNDLPEDVVFDFRAERNRLRASFRLTNTGQYDAPGRSNDFKPGTDFTDLDIVTGTLERDESPHRSLFIDDDIFMARDARNPGTYESRVHSLVDGGTPAHEGSYLVSSGLVPVDEFLPPGVTWCDCSYTKWGWWGGELANAADTAQYRSHLATFVAGTLPGLPDIPASGSASYSGHLVGPVTNRDDMYVAVGNFEKTWNFATRTGSVAISDFDGASYAGASTSPGGRDFSGRFASTTASYAGRSGDLAGSFFRADSDPVGEVGGRFRVEDPVNGYGATGIFQAARTAQ